MITRQHTGTRVYINTAHVIPFNESRIVKKYFNKDMFTFMVAIKRSGAESKRKVRVHHTCTNLGDVYKTNLLYQVL